MRGGAAALRSAVIALVGLSTACASASATFTPAQPFAQAKWLNGGHDLALDDSGRAFVVWDEYDGQSSQVHGRWIDPAGLSGPVIDISARGPGFGSPRLVATDGRAFVAWIAESGPEPRRSVLGRWIEANGNLGPTLHLMDAPNGPTSGFVIEINLGADGRVSVGAPTDTAFGLRRVDGDSRLSPLIPIGEPNTRAKLAARPDGGTVAAWGTAGSVMASIATRTGEISTPVAVSTTPYASYSNVAVDGTGRSLVVWRWSDVQDSIGGSVNVRARLLDASGQPVGDELYLDEPGTSFMFAQVSVAGGPSGFVAAWPRFWTSPSGNQQAAWTRGVSTDGVVLGPTPALSSPNSYADHVRVSLGGDGNGLVAWDSPVGVRSIDVSGAPTSSITDLGSSFDSRYALSAFSRKADAGAVIWQNPGYDTVPDTGLIAFQLGPVACADVTATATQGSPVSIPLSCSGAGISSATVLGGPSHGTIDGLPIPGGLKFVYRPAKDFVGPDVFAFRVANPVGVSNVTHARISVNRAPVAKRKRLSKIFRLRILRRGGLRLVLRMYAGVRVRIAVTSRSGTRWKKVRSVTIKRKRPGTVRVRLGSKATAAHHRHRTIRVRVIAPATSSTEAQRVTRFIKGR